MKLTFTRTLTWKTTWRFAALVTVTTVLVLAVGAWLLDRQMRRGLTLLHEGEARELAGLLAGAAPTPEAVRACVARDSDGDAEWFFIQIHDEAGAVLFRSTNLGTALLPDLSSGEMRRVADLPGVGTVQITEVRTGGWHIQVGSPLTLERLLVADYARVGAGLTALAGLAAIGLGYGFSRVTLRPLRAIAETAERVSGENLRDRIQVPDTKDEMAAVARVLNNTFDRLETSFEQVRRFSADASHELKTPLALMRLNAERLRERAGADQAGLDDLLEAVARMQTVIDRLLFLARAEGGGLALVRQSVRMAEFSANFSEDASVLMEESGGKFEVVARDDGEAKLDAGLVRQLLLNLVSNAARVSPPGGVVRLEVGRDETRRFWLLTVTDEGPGLPPEQLERVFGRFVRFDPAPAPRVESASGHGLGLAICRGIAQVHGGSIRAENRLDGHRGLRVVVKLPDGP